MAWYFIRKWLGFAEPKPDPEGMTISEYLAEIRGEMDEHSLRVYREADHEGEALPPSTDFNDLIEVHEAAIRNVFKYPTHVMGSGPVCKVCGETMKETISGEFVRCETCGWSNETEDGT
jgi:hypothetical protein